MLPVERHKGLRFSDNYHDSTYYSLEIRSALTGTNKPISNS